MNTRLQVEHPVTEAVAQRDLVADQLAIAAGAQLADLGLDQAGIDRQLAAGGHAVEARLYAEDAENGFLPATGRVAALTWPAGDGIRVDAGIAAGTDVGPRFDPIARQDRGGRARTGRTPSAGSSERSMRPSSSGSSRTCAFLRWLVREPAVRQGLVRTSTLDQIWPPDDWTERSLVPDAAWSAAASAPRRPGVRPVGHRPRRLRRRVPAERSSRHPARDRRPRAVRRRALARGEPHDGVLVDDTAFVDVGGRSLAFRIAPPPDVDRAARAAAGHIHGGGPRTVESPMPGGVVTVHVGVGDIVEAGAPLVTLEAMKMEHVVVAHGPGRVTEVLVRPGAQVGRGDGLATIDDAALPLPPEETR